MKICFVIPDLRVGGAENNLIRLCDALADSGAETHIILLSNRVDLATGANIKLHYLSNEPYIIKKKIMNTSIQKKANNYILSRLLKGKIESLETNGLFDLIVSRLDHAHIVCSYLKRDNYYYSFHNAESYKYRNFTQHSRNRKFRKLRERYRNKKLIAVSKGVSYDLLQVIGIKPKSIDVIYNGFDFTRIRKLSTEDIGEHPPFIINVGILKGQKRHDLLIKAFKAANIPHHLYIIGDGPERSKLIKLITEHKLTDKVHLLGKKENPYPWIKAADLFVLSSDFEGLPTVLVETLIIGTPAISTDCDHGPSEIFGNDYDALVSTGDELALSQKIHSFIAGNIRNNNIDIDKFTIDKTVEAYYRLSTRSKLPSRS